MRNSIFEILIIPLLLNIINQKTANAKSIILYIIKKLIEYSLKNAVVKEVFNSLFSNCFYFKVGWYEDPCSGLQEEKGLNF